MGQGAFKRSRPGRALAAAGVFVVACVPSSREPRRSPPEPEAFVAPNAASEARADLDPPRPDPPPPGPASEPGQADLDPSNDGVVAPPPPVPDCAARLEAAGVVFRPAELPLQSANRGTITCGAEQVVEYRGSPSGIRYNAFPVLTCTMALGLARFERVLQEEAEAQFGARVKRVTHAGTYSCRRMARFGSMISEHSYANAIDLRSVTLANGRTVAVLRDFGPPEGDPLTREAQFLRRIAHRAFDEKIFSVVLTPLFDTLHRDHFHFDMARYRVDGTR
jgi:hypothetical protein